MVCRHSRRSAYRRPLRPSGRYRPCATSFQCSASPADTRLAVRVVVVGVEVHRLRVPGEDDRREGRWELDATSSRPCSSTAWRSRFGRCPARGRSTSSWQRSRPHSQREICPGMLCTGPYEALLVHPTTSGRSSDSSRGRSLSTINSVSVGLAACAPPRSRCR
jgi:hypothetical protein